MRKIGAIFVRYNNAKGFLSSLRIGRDKEKFELGEQFFIRAFYFPITSSVLKVEPKQYFCISSQKTLS